eukprot:scaffold955_cov79-Skeletonema_dohrnii-CCMP3373.AAC.3
MLAVNERSTTSIWQYPSRDCLTLTRVYELGLRHFEDEGEAEVAHVGNPLSHRGLRDFVTTPLSAPTRSRAKALEGKQMPQQRSDCRCLIGAGILYPSLPVLYFAHAPSPASTLPPCR